MLTYYFNSVPNTLQYFRPQYFRGNYDGEPNPLLIANRSVTTLQVRKDKNDRYELLLPYAYSVD